MHADLNDLGFASEAREECASNFLLPQRRHRAIGSAFSVVPQNGQRAKDITAQRNNLLSESMDYLMDAMRSSVCLNPSLFFTDSALGADHPALKTKTSFTTRQQNIIDSLMTKAVLQAGVEAAGNLDSFIDLHSSINRSEAP